MAIASGLAIAATGCASEETFRLPMTAAELATFDSGPALVAYLSQPDASATVCDTRARGPHVAAWLNERMRGALVAGLRSGRVPPALWYTCADSLLKRATPEDAASLLDDVGRAYRSMVKDSDFEKSPPMQERVEAMQRLYLERKNRIHDAHDALQKLFADLRTALAAHRLGPIGTRLGSDLIAAVDLEGGKWRGHTVDVTVLDSLFHDNDEKTLQLFVDRLPGDDIRNEARRRIVRIHIASSPFSEVRANASVVEESLMKSGVNAVTVVGSPPSRGWIDEDKIPMRGVLVRQDVWGQTATLLGYRNNRPPLSILPDVQLRGALMMDVTGVSRPVTLCAPRIRSSRRFSTPARR